VTFGEMVEGLNSLRGRTVFEAVFMPRVYVRGDRTRAGFEAEWNPGSLGFRGEYIRVNEQRIGQGLGDADLSDYIGESWYVSATWVVTGEEKAGGVRPRGALFRQGIGAVEIGGRLESLRFGSASRAGPAFTNPRADHVAPNEVRVWTTGVSWFVNRWVRFTGNAIREALSDAARAPIAGERIYWSGILRFQLVV
jgi:phosphate-selective porin